MVGHIARANQDRPMIGIALILSAYFCFSLIDTSVKWLVIAGLPAMQLAFMRYAGHFVISFVYLMKSGGGLENFQTERPLLIVLRSALLAGSTILNFVALNYLPLTLTSTILFLAPIIVCALSWPILGERVGPYRWAAIMVGFGGIVVAIRPFDADFHWAAILSLGSVTCFAFYNVLTRMLAGVVASDTMQFYSGLVGTVVFLPFAAVVWVNPETTMGWIVMFMIGGFGWFGHELLTRAYGFADASRLIPFGYSFMIYLTIWSYLLFDHTPEFWTVVGALIVAASGLTIWAREITLKRRARTS
jgi:drug/metabolite transporter (DMT)-like permease